MSQHVANSVAAELGFNLESVGEDHLRSAIATARSRVGAATELHKAMIDAMVVPESWFFREEPAFEFLRHRVAASSGHLRVLCAPCARGEEPWSVAMTIASMGRAPQSFDVLGIDVSPAAVAHARLGEYQRLSLRGNAVPKMDVWAEPLGDGIRVGKALRGSVRFEVVNLTQPLPWLNVWGSFDIIFCRNLMVYLTQAARRQVIDSLKALLSPGGVIITSSADFNLFLPFGLTRAKDSPPFVLGPSERENRLALQLPAVNIPPPSGSVPPVQRTAGVSSPAAPVDRSAPRVPPALPLAAGVTATATAPAAPVLSLADDELRRARTMADLGMHADALTIIARVMAAGVTADALELQGLVYLDANRLVEATQCYLKLFELAPDRADILRTLASISDRRGRHDVATTYRDRAAAMEKRSAQ
jgi:chemotaxis protein methyltransferase WspC